LVVEVELEGDDDDDDWTSVEEVLAVVVEAVDRGDSYLRLLAEVLEVAVDPDRVDSDDLRCRRLLPR
jgi:hypothetical protein